MPIKPRGNTVILRPKEKQETTKSGLFLSKESVSPENEGRVLWVGPGVAEDIVIGLTVIYNSYAGEEIKIDGNTYIAVTDTSIIVTLSD